MNFIFVTFEVSILDIFKEFNFLQHENALSIVVIFDFVKFGNSIEVNK